MWAISWNAWWAVWCLGPTPSPKGDPQWPSASASPTYLATQHRHCRRIYRCTVGIGAILSAMRMEETVVSSIRSSPSHHYFFYAFPSVYAYCMPSHQCMPTACLPISVCLLHAFPSVYAYYMPSHQCMPTTYLPISVCLLDACSCRPCMFVPIPVDGTVPYILVIAR